MPAIETGLAIATIAEATLMTRPNRGPRLRGRNAANSAAVSEAYRNLERLELGASKG